MSQGLARFGCMLRVVLTVLLLVTGAGIVVGIVAPAGAQEAPGDEIAPDASSPSVAPVVVDGRTLFSLRGVSALPARERARRVTQHIRRVADDRTLDPADLQIERVDGVWQIRIGDNAVMGVVQADARMEGVRDPKLLAGLYRERIARAIETYREEREAAALMWDVAYALIATAVLLLVFWIVRWSSARTTHLLETRYKQRIDKLEARTFRLLDAERVWFTLRGLVRAVKVATLVAAAYFYLSFVLALFPWTRPWGNRLADWVVGPVTAIGTGIVEAIPGLVFIALLVLIVRYLLKTMRLFFSAIAEQRIRVRNFYPEWGWPTYRIVRVVVLVFAAVVAYPYIPGSDSAAFKGISIFLGVILSLGSSSAIANIIAGYSMTYRRAFREGDRIKIGDLTGDVEELRLLVTHLRSLKNEEVVIPNSLILNSNVVNYSTLAAGRGLILHTTVGIGYEVPWRQVEAMLRMAADRTPGLLRQPAPFVLQQALGDYAVTYELNVYCDNPKAMVPLYSSLHRNILDVFNEYQVQIMTPSYVHDPEQPKLVPQDQWFAAPAAPPGRPSKQGRADE